MEKRSLYGEAELIWRRGAYMEKRSLYGEAELIWISGVY
jgi:hypothetical protein